MKFLETSLEGCRLLHMDRSGDSRGYFARTFCALEFAAAGIQAPLAQSSLSYNQARGTLRGLHFQKHPQMEGKLVRCVRGAVFDVMVDLRFGSPTFGKWYGAELTEDNDLQLYSEPGFAHGFQTLTTDAIVSYHITRFYDGSLSAGVRWDDPNISIDWPLAPTIQSERDLQLPSLTQIQVESLLPYGTT